MKTKKAKTNLDEISCMLKVIAEPKRLEILELLLQGTHCNCEIVDKLSMAPNLISHHMRVLHEAGLVAMERDPVDARWVYYSVAPKAVETFLVRLAAFFDTSQMEDRRSNYRPGCRPAAKKAKTGDLVMTPHFKEEVSE